MRVGSELKDAFIEASSDVEVSCTKKAQMKYDLNSGSVAVGNGSDAEFMITSQYKTINELRSAFYPTGTFLHSLLDQAAFREFMGDDSIVAVENKWRAVSTFTDDTDANYVLVELATSLGTYLQLAGATEKEVLGVDYVLMANPKGRYLRGADVSQTKDGIILDSNTPMNDAVQSHGHSIGTRGAAFLGDDEGHLGYNWAGTGANNLAGGNETRPETLVCNLYIKVNE